MNNSIDITIKPTLECNMRCRHCFNGEKLNENGMLGLDPIKRVLRAAARDYHEIKTTFHGGEPSLAGDDFFDQFYSFQRLLAAQYGINIYNNFTTNGLLLSEKLVDILISNNVLINISFDGPYNYILRSNSDIVFSKIELLKQKNARFRVFCTVSEQSRPHLEETYQFFKDYEIDYKLVPIQPRGFASQDMRMIMQPTIFGRSIAELYSKWCTDRNNNNIVYTFQEFTHLRRSEQFKPFWFQKKIAINPDGNIYPFGRPNDMNYCLGSAEKLVSVHDCFNSDNYKRLLSEFESYWRNVCVHCSNYSICRGVVICMSYVYDNKVDTLRYSCELSNAIFDSILAANEQILKNIQEGNGNGYNDYVKRSFSS